MYADLLTAALEDPAGPPGAVGVAGLLAELDRRRADVDRRPTGGPSGWAPVSVATQVAYDAALVRLARAAGLEPVLSTFRRPGDARRALETALASLGVLPSSPRGTAA